MYTLQFKSLGQFYYNSICITFIKQGHIKLIKSNIKDIYNVSKDFLNFLFVKESRKKVWFPQKIYYIAQLYSTLIIIRNVSWAANQNVSEGSHNTKDWSNDAVNSALHHMNQLHFKVYTSRRPLFYIWMIFHNITVLPYFYQINVALVSLRHEKHEKNPTDHKHLKNYTRTQQVIIEMWDKPLHNLT